MRDHRRWLATVVRELTVTSDGGRESMAAIAVNTIATAVTAVTRFKKSEIQTHCFSTLDEICWTVF